jgi:thiol-disulfide isomerase/thioredoxin
MKSLLFALAAGAFLLPANGLRAADAKPAAATASAGTASAGSSTNKFLLPDSADEAWTAVQQAMRPPAAPAAWNDRAPTDAEQAEYRKVVATAAGAAADRAKEFQQRFPKHAKAEEAKTAERAALYAAVSLGDDSRKAALETAGGPPSSTPPPQDEFGKKADAAIKKAQSEGAGDLKAVARALLPAVRDLKKEFPDRQELDQLLFECAQILEDSPEGLAIAKEVEAAPNPPELKAKAAALRKKIEMIGKPLSLAYTAVDGRKVDLVQLKGKVVLIDFWATWCGPCVRELPNVKRAYEKLHPQGFEIVGISFDSDESALKTFTKQQEMSWPQFFDGQGWQNKFAQEFGISSIPAMWLVDKKGVLRITDARPKLEEKVKELLDEK